MVKVCNCKNNVCMSVYLYVSSAPILEKGLFFLCTFLFIYDHLFYKYFVRRSVGQATKGKNVRI